MSSMIGFGQRWKWYFGWEREMIGGRDFCVDLTAFEEMDPLDGDQEKCRLWQDGLFKVFATNCHGGRGLFIRPFNSPPILRHF